MILSILLPGLGQVYNGRLAQGAVFWGAGVVVIPLAARLSLLGPPAWIWVVNLLGLICTFVVYVASAAQAYFKAGHIGGGFKPAWYNRLAVYVVFLLCGHFVMSGIIWKHTAETVTRVYRVPSVSMMPTLLPGDYFLADKRRQRVMNEIRRGDLIVFSSADGNKQRQVKRVIGLGGDRIEITGTRVRINGDLTAKREIKKPQGSFAKGMTGRYGFYREILGSSEYTTIWEKSLYRDNVMVVVPKDHIFVLGDNRDNSHDSRHFGPLPLTGVHGKPLQVCFSLGRGLVRWNRIGRLLK